jgi:hypothetical protein
MSDKSAKSKTDGDSSFVSAEMGVLVLLCIILFIAVQYSYMKVRYNDIYQIYAPMIGKNVFVNIGPQRIMLGYEYPKISSMFLSRPITQTAAEFLLRIIRVRRPPAIYLFKGFSDDTSQLQKLVANADSWNQAGNPLKTIGGIGFETDLVQNYGDGTPAKPIKDYSLEILWRYGYEEYIRQRFTESSTSVMQEWDYMFGETAKAPNTNKDNACNATSMAAGAISQAAMFGAMGAAAGPPGMAVMGLIGAASSLFSTPQCLGL